MAWLFKNGSRWWGGDYVEGKQRRFPLIPPGHSKATTSKTIAAHLLNRYKALQSRQDDKTPIPALLEAWEAATEQRGSKKQATRNRSIVDLYLKFHNIEHPDQITRPSVETWVLSLKENGLSPKTQLNHKTALSSFCNYLIQSRGMLFENPCSHIRIKVPRKAPRALTEGQLKQAFELAREKGCLMELSLLIYTGARTGEICRMEWDDINWETNTLVIPKSKSNRPRSIPITSKLLFILTANKQTEGPIIPGRQKKTNRYSGYIKDSTLRNRLRWLQNEFPGVFTEGRGPHETGRLLHGLRSTTATIYVNKGGDIGRLGVLLGHVDPKTTKRYALYRMDRDEVLEKI